MTDQRGSKKTWTNRLIALESRFIPEESRRDGGLEYWRKVIGVALIWAAIVLSPIAAIPTLWAAPHGNFWLIIIGVAIAYLTTVGMFLFPAIPSSVRAVIGTLLCYFLAVVIVAVAGPISSWIAWLFGFAVLASVLLGLRATMAAIILNGLTIFAVGWLIDQGYIAGYGYENLPLANRLAALAGILFVNTLVAISSGLLVRRLADTHQKQTRIAEDLFQERALLISAKSSLEREVEERRLAERAAAASLAKYRHLADMLPEMVYEMNIEGQLTFLNQAVYSKFGYTSADFETGLTATGMLVPEDRARAGKNVGRIFRGENIDGIEYTAVTKQGERFPILVYSAAMMEDGRPIGLRGVAIDNTRRKRAEMELAQREAMLASILRVAPIGVGVTGGPGDRKFIQVNDRLCQMVGYTREELLGRETTLFYPNRDEHARVSRELIRQLKGWGTGEIESIWRRKDGRTINVWLNATPFEPDAPEAEFVFTALDITERKQAERSIQDSEKQYRDLFNSITDLIYTQDLDGRFLSVNRALADLFGYSPAELIGRRASDFMKPKYRVFFESEYLAQMKTVGRYDGVGVYVTRSGQSRFIDYSSVLVEPEDGPAHISGSGRDVTKTIISQKEMTRLQEQLVHSQKMEAVGTLSSVIAHDFNNLLQTISGFSQTMIANGGLSESDLGSMAKIETAVSRGAALVRRLLAFSRKEQPVRERVDLRRIIEEAITLLDRTIPKMIRIETGFKPDLKAIDGDPVQLEQVLMNLAANSRDAMPDGGRLVIEAENIDFADLPAGLDLAPGDYIHWRISDNGVGMDRATLGRIFEPFFTTKGVGQGTGLGLATVYGIVSGHGGAVTCSSEPGRGTDFDIYLPAADRMEPDSAPPEEEPVSPSGGRETILLVDDEEAIREVGREWLSQAGYRVLTASTGEQALDVYRDQGGRDQGGVDMVVLDMGMPGMGGGKCLEELIKIDPQVRILIASGYAAENRLNQVVAAGAKGFIDKPYRLSALMDNIREILDNEE